MELVYGQFSKDHLNKIKTGIELFNQKKYWECHEELEDLWMEDRQDKARDVYWAIIQVAAACIHVREKNLIGAQGMMSKAKEKFRRCREQNTLTELVFQYLDWQELEDMVLRIPDGTASTLEDFQKIYQFKFKHYAEVL